MIPPIIGPIALRNGYKIRVAMNPVIIAFQSTINLLQSQLSILGFGTN
jgi:hypothetical protein